MKFNKSLGGRIAHMEAGSSQKLSNYTQIKDFEKIKLIATCRGIFEKSPHDPISNLTIHMIKKCDTDI